MQPNKISVTQTDLISDYNDSIIVPRFGGAIDADSPRKEGIQRRATKFYDGALI